MVERELTQKAKEDLKLIEKALSKGDPRAYNALMSKYRDPIFFMLYEKVSDKDAEKLAFDISQQIQTDMTYPGQVKITVIRETRAVNIAK